MKLPTFKKKVNDFLLCEEGKISKQAIVAVGGIAGAIALGSLDAKEAMAGKAVGDSIRAKASQVCGIAEPGPTHSECYGHNNGADPLFNQTTNTLKVAHQHHYNHGSHASHGSHSSCCLAPGTLILMADKKHKPIEEITEGENVCVWDIENKKIAVSEVLKLKSPQKNGFYSINNGSLNITEDHPILMKKNDKYYWAAVDKEAAKVSYPDIGKIQQLRIGKTTMMLSSESLTEVIVEKIDYIEKSTKTYTFQVKEHHNFFADGFVVHNMGVIRSIFGCSGP